MNLEGGSETIASTEPRKVVVTDIDISFSDWVGLLVKATLAAIPAAIIVAIVVALLIAVFGLMLGR